MAIWKDLSAQQRWEALKTIVRLTDFTTLNPTDTRATLEEMRQIVDQLQELGLPLPASICVYPVLIVNAREVFPELPVASVVSFPDGMSLTETKAAEAQHILQAGADEIDLVPYWGPGWQVGDFTYALKDIQAVRVQLDQAQKQHLKVIFETALWTEDAVLAATAYRVLEVGATFLKTSTGRRSPGATVHHARLFAHVVRNFWENTHQKRGVKLSGGIRTPEQAWELIQTVQEILPWADSAQYLRIGASKLLRAVLDEARQLQ